MVPVRCGIVDVVFIMLARRQAFQSSLSFTALCQPGAKTVVPSEDYSHGPPHWQVPLAPALVALRKEW
jgi:hypothetical protein